MSTSSGHKQFQDVGKRKNDNSQGDGNKKKKGDVYVPLYHVHTKLNETKERIFITNKRVVPFRRADNLKGTRPRRDMSQYYRYHRDHGHITDECKPLKDEIPRVPSAVH